MGAILKQENVTIYLLFCFEQRRVTLNFFGNITNLQKEGWTKAPFRTA